MANLHCAFCHHTLDEVGRLLISAATNPVGICESCIVLGVTALADLASLPPAPSVVTWQPIETAPKTGDDLIEKCVLGYCANEEHPNDRYKVVWWEPKIKGGVWWSDQDLACEPTHWMPLPALPGRTLPEGE